MKKLPIEDYPKDIAPVVLLWNDKFANPVVGKLYDENFYLVKSCGGFIDDSDCGFEIPFGFPVFMPDGRWWSRTPTHFSYLQEEG